MMVQAGEEGALVQGTATYNVADFALKSQWMERASRSPKGIFIWKACRI